MFQGKNLFDIEGDDFVKFVIHIAPMLFFTKWLNGHIFRDSVDNKGRSCRPRWTDRISLKKLRY